MTVATPEVTTKTANCQEYSLDTPNPVGPGKWGTHDNYNPRSPWTIPLKVTTIGHFKTCIPPQLRYSLLHDPEQPGTDPAGLPDLRRH